MQLLALYEALLKALNFTVSNEGLLSYVYDGEAYPATIGDKRLVLPTPQVLRAGLGDHLIAWHPLSENLLRGESEVLRNTKAIANHRLVSVLTDLLLQFATLGVDTGRHKHLSPKAGEVLSAMPGVDEKFVETLKKILAKQEKSGPNQLVSIYLKRGGTYKGHKAQRVAVVSFPIMDQLDNDPDAVFGVKVRKKDVQILQGLMQYVLPNCDDLETYSAPSQSMTAPYFDALMRAFANTAGRLNQVIEWHRKTLPSPDELLIDLSYLDNFDDLARYEGQIPALAGNEGETPKEDDRPGITGTSVGPQAQFAAPAQIAGPTPVGGPLVQQGVNAMTSHSAAQASAPVRSEPETANSPFKVANVSASLRQQTQGMFAPGGTQVGATTLTDPNKFERPAGSSSGRDEYAEWEARRQQNLQRTQAQMYGMMQPQQPTNLGFGVQQPMATNVPNWMQPAVVQQTAPGEYAGRVRGVSIMQQGYAPIGSPGWVSPLGGVQQQGWNYGGFNGGGGFGAGGGFSGQL